MEIPYTQIGIELVRREFESQPPDLQHATRERVRRLLIEESLRNQTSQSFLMRIAHIYGLGVPTRGAIKRPRDRHGRRS